MIVKLLTLACVVGGIMQITLATDVKPDSNPLDTSPEHNAVEPRYLPYDVGYWLGTLLRPRPARPTYQFTTQSPNAITTGSNCSCSTRMVKRDTVDPTEDPTDEFRIVGGSPTKPHAYPQMAVVIYNQNQMCGGTILNNEWILTAAHCVKGKTDVSKFRVIIGAYNLDEVEPNRKVVGVKRAIANSQFNMEEFDHDVALLQLDTKLNFNKDVKPTCVPTKVKDYTGDDAIATGWGRTIEDGASSRVLREVTVPVMSNTECSRSYQSQFTIYNSMICAGDANGGKDSCAGDSGGPLFVSQGSSPPVQIGITSFGLGCARPGKPGVYSRVDRAIDFINKNVVTDGCTMYTNDA